MAYEILSQKSSFSTLRTVHSEKVEDFRRLDIREMQRAGLFKNHWSGLWEWRDPSSLKVRASVAVQTTEKVLRLRYLFSGVTVFDDLRLQHIPCKFGGTRVLVQCPSCTMAYGILYLKNSVFRCRKCHGLKYATQSETKHGRLAIKKHKLSAKLAGRCRPKGMHKKTYFRIRRALIETKTELFAVLRRRMEV